MRFALGLIGLLLTMPAEMGCRSLTRKVTTVDTTKDVYEDDEAPTVQVYVVNGVAKEIPWAKVPEAQRWAFEMEGQRYRFRVPIVKIIVLAWDKDGRQVPEKGAARVETTEVTLNPKYTLHAFSDDRH